jgi:hypothetical protein
MTIIFLGYLLYAKSLTIYVQLVMKSKRPRYITTWESKLKITVDFEDGKQTAFGNV